MHHLYKPGELCISPYPEWKSNRSPVARTVEQLKQKALDLLDFIGREGSAVDLIQLAYTLQVGREAMEERLGFMVSSIAQLAEKLQAYINEAPDTEGVYQGQVKRGKESISIISQDAEVKAILIGEYIAKKKLSNLLNLWVKGWTLTGTNYTESSNHNA